VSRLLLDANLSPSLAEALRWRGHDALHVRDVGLETASDPAIFLAASRWERAVVTHDDDYLRLLRRGTDAPSVVHLSQRELQRDPVVGRLAQAMRLTEVLHELGDRLEQGIAVRVGARGMRVEPLPLRGPREREPTGRPLPPRSTGHAAPGHQRRTPGASSPDRAQPGELVRERRMHGPGGRGR
jgi:predicted nuclease of predicted toxin-antitoxin system